MNNLNTKSQKFKDCSHCNDTGDSFGNYVSTYCHLKNDHLIFTDSKGCITKDTTEMCENCKMFLKQVDLSSVLFKKDSVTRKYVETHQLSLKRPVLCYHDDLAEAITYCVTCENPYSEELAKRAGLLNEYLCASNEAERCEVIRRAAKHFGITLV